MADTPLNDDYIANLLIQDAKDITNRALRRSVVAPKPNTRFLSNIIKQADGHNAALKRKEEREAKERRRQLERNDGRLTPPTKEDDLVDKSTHKRRRTRSSDYHDEGRSQYRRRHRGGDERPRSNHRHDNDHPSRDWCRDSKRRSRSPRMAASSSRVETRRSRSRSPSKEEDRNRHRARRHNCGPDRDGSKSHRKRHTCDDNSIHDNSKRSTIPEEGEHRISRLAPPRQKKSSDKRDHGNPQNTARTSPAQPASPISSDSQDEVFGPTPAPIDRILAPKVRGRGRGTYTTSSGIDKHFASEYDPATDVQPDIEKVQDDWDQALDAMRDRRKWRQTGSQRLRDAGFNEDAIKQWETQNGVNVSSHGDIGDVKWTKVGDREWDRGKVLDDASGGVRLEAEWGRLKDI